MSRPTHAPAAAASPAAASSSSSAASPLPAWLRALTATPARSAAIALAATTAVAVVMGALRYAHRRGKASSSRGGSSTSSEMPALESVPQPPQRTAKAKRTTTGTATATPPPHRDWTADEFIRAATQLLERLGNEHAIHPGGEAALRAAMPQVLKMNTPARAIAAHFLLAANAYHLTQSETEEEFQEITNKQNADMELAWSLLDCPAADPAERHGLDIMRIQVAQCRRDAALMVPVFERLISTPLDELDPETLVLLFTTAPLLGRWRQTVALGDMLAQIHDLAEFHGSPMDYQILYELAKTEQTRGDAPLSQLQWQNYKICMQRMKLQSAECSDDETVQSLEAEFTQDGVRAWKLLPQDDTLRLVRCGALAQVRSFTPVPLALVGPASDTRMHLQGYVLLGGGEQQRAPQQKQTETYDLRRVPVGELEGAALQGEGADDSELPADALHWRGTFTMVQEPVGEAQAHMPVLRAVWELEMAFVPHVL